MAAPLPPNPYHPENQLLFNRAYTICLGLDSRHAQASKLPDGKLDEVLVCARFLGYMVLEAPTDKGRTHFSEEIVRCSTDADLQKLAELYKDHFLRLFRGNKGRTPTPSHHPSAPSFDAQKQQFGLLLIPTPSNHTEAKKYALRRDGYRCAFTGKLDLASVENNLVKEDGTAVTKTQLAHIFDLSTNEDLRSENMHAYAASAHAVLSRFGQIDSIAELNGKSVHRLENVLTLASDVHQIFDELKLWLERKSDDPINHYRLRAARSGILVGMRDLVILTNHAEEDIPLPDPRYLALHAACARVANLSGTAAYIDHVLRDIEEVGVLAADGGSDALYHALVRRTDVAAY